MNHLRDDIDVLHVDDDGQLVELAATFLERYGDAIAVDTTTAPEEALEMATERPFDCVVSDYQMPRMDGLELFERLRSRGVDVPFVLFTGRGSEEIASEAISMGVTEYLQKQSGTEQYGVLANRIRNVVFQHRAETRMRRGYRALDAAPVGVLLADTRLEHNPIVYANETFQELTGRERGELLGRNCRTLREEADSAGPIRRLWEAIESGEPVSAELVDYRKNGTELETRVDVAPIGDGEGSEDGDTDGNGGGGEEVTHFVGFVTDLGGAADPSD